MVKHKNQLWKIKTRKEHSEYGQDYVDDVDSKEGTLQVLQRVILLTILILEGDQM